MKRKPTIADELLYACAQLGPGKLRAYLDLFMGRFADKVDWGSGLGEIIYTLYALVRTLRPDVVVEIGSAKGKSTCAMALACNQNRKGKVYAIDPHTANYWSDIGSENTSYDFLLNRLRRYKLEPWCEVIRKTSKEALTKPPMSKIDLLFIDGDHSYEGVKLDFELCRPLLTEYAVVLFHDSAWGHVRDDSNRSGGRDCREGLGVPKFLEGLRREGYESVTLACGPGLTVLQPLRGGFPYRFGQEGADSAEAKSFAVESPLPMTVDQGP